MPGFDIALMNEPCYAVGGDYYDFLPLGPGARPVSDWEVSANVQTQATSTFKPPSALSLVLNPPPLDLLAESLNRMILAGTRGGKYLTMFLALIDIRRQTLDYINCGHVPPGSRQNRKGRPSSPTEGGMVVGLFDNMPYKIKASTNSRAGDVLVLCTDGITESMGTKPRRSTGRSASPVAFMALSPKARPPSFMQSTPM